MKMASKSKIATTAPMAIPTMAPVESPDDEDELEAAGRLVVVADVAAVGEDVEDVCVVDVAGGL